MEDWELDMVVDVCRRGDGGDAIEDLRCAVTPADLDGLVDLYFGFGDDWVAKCCMVQLVQDQSSPILTGVWRDVLRVPELPERCDLAPMALAVALCALDGDASPEAFMRYFEDRELARAEARRRLAGGPG